MQLLSLAIEGSFNLPMIIGGCIIRGAQGVLGKEKLKDVVKDVTSLEDEVKMEL